MAEEYTLVDELNTVIKNYPDDLEKVAKSLCNIRSRICDAIDKRTYYEIPTILIVAEDRFSENDSYHFGVFPKEHGSLSYRIKSTFVESQSYGFSPFYLINNIELPTIKSTYSLEHKIEKPHEKEILISWDYRNRKTINNFRDVKIGNSKDECYIKKIKKVLLGTEAIEQHFESENNLSDYLKAMCVLGVSPSDHIFDERFKQLYFDEDYFVIKRDQNKKIKSRLTPTKKCYKILMAEGFGSADKVEVEDGFKVDPRGIIEANKEKN